ncbi:Protein NAS-15 [Aphelenchoides avenae]|nr:Protein NAS-15 [Aphelenchus avenae]
MAYKMPLDDESLFYDRNAPTYETVLTPEDFELGAKLAERQHFQGDAKDVWDSDAMYSPEKFEGDIANEASTGLASSSGARLAPEGAPEDTNHDFQLNAIRDRRQLWKNGRIPYALSSQYSSYSRSVIAASMQEYNKHTCIEWSPRTSADRDYVYIMPDRGCYSMVGRTGGRQTLSLGNGCIQKGIIIHEMMHAVGQFEKYSSATIQTLGSDYDYASIMHYGPKAFSRNGLPTIVPKRSASIGQRTGFSPVDSSKINTLYECTPRGAPPPSPTTRPPMTQRPTQRTMTTTITPLTITTRRSPSAATNSPGETCRNTRPDCDQLAQQGWCSRNPGWMKDHCPISCNDCEKKPEGSCEDLRVDCAELVKKRYCITSPTFMRTYCAMSCGFCLAPVSTEKSLVRATMSPVDGPTMVTKTPLVTFWTTPRIEERPIVATSPKPVTTTKSACKDKKHFCMHWKNAGFCQGIFLSYMKKNCPAACGWC